MGKNAWGRALMAVFMAVGVVAQAPSPLSSSSDCTSAITSLSPCESFLLTSTNETKPPNDCCTALSAIVLTKVLCLCQILSANNNLGLPINRTKVLAVPRACNVKIPSMSQCAAAGAPLTSFGVPVSSPASSPVTAMTRVKAPAPSTKATTTPSFATPPPVIAPVTAVSPTPTSTGVVAGLAPAASPPAGAPAPRRFSHHPLS